MKFLGRWAVSAGMVFPHRTLLWLIVTLFAVAAARADVGIGDRREDVLQLFGPPPSRAAHGNKEIFMYPHGGRIEFVDGKVADVRGPLPTPVETSAIASPTSESATTATSAGGTPGAPTAKPVQPPAKSTNAKATAPVGATSSTAALDAMGKQIEKMDTAWGERPKVPAPARELNVPKLAVSVLLHLLVTLLALKIAFKVEEMDALWTGIFAIAGIDVALYGALEALGPVTSGFSSMGALESGIGALVMVFTIQKFCFTKKLNYAVVTAMSVKLIVRLCHMFLFVLILHALFE